MNLQTTGNFSPDKKVNLKVKYKLSVLLTTFTLMHIVEVTTPNLETEFIEFPPSLYKDDKHYIRPWDHDIKEVFDETKNKWFREGEVIRWLLKDEQEITIGRIAAFTHPNLEKKGESCGGCGFFECINNQQAANILFDKAKEWLQERGKTMMNGPINFGEKDKWWGLLVDGFEPPLYGMNYNPPYYQQLFEKYGFQLYYNQLVFRYDLEKPIPRKFYVGYERLMHKDPNYRFETASLKNLDKYAEDFRIVYNKAWADAHKGFKPMKKEQTRRLMNTLKPIMIEDALIFGYHNDQPIGIFISIPNINQVIQYLNGKFGWWEKLKFMYHLKLKKSYNTLAGIIFGVVPEFQGKGVDAGLIVLGDKKLRMPGKYRFFEMMWIGDFNPKMISLVKQMGTEQSKTLATYRYLFDRNAEFQRHPIVNS